MKQVNGKPKKWQWMLSVGLILTGLLLQLPPFPGVLRDRLAPPLLISGFVVLLVLWRRVEKFEDLPLEEQKEREREDRDPDDLRKGRLALLAGGDGAVHRRLYSGRPFLGKNSRNQSDKSPDFFLAPPALLDQNFDF